MTKFEKGATVFYTAPIGTTFQAKVKTRHRDGSVSVECQHVVSADGRPVPGYYGYVYQMAAEDLRDTA